MMVSIENKEMRQAKERLQRACNMFSLAITDIDIGIAMQEQILAEKIIGRIVKEMKEKEKAHA